jgi:hypothetical protein
MIRIHLFGSMPPVQCIQKHLFKLLTKSIEHTTGIGTERLHIAQVRIAREVTFEAIFISTLLVAHLTEELELLKSLGLHSLVQVFYRALFCLWHG